MKLPASLTDRLAALAMPQALAAARMAMDRSMRSYCEDGRLHVEATNISKAAVNPYLGSTIPDAERLGLDPDRTYQLFRDPIELARAAPSFNNLPLLSRHVAVSAADHRPDLVVGSTGNDAAFDAPYLIVSLVVWAADAIAAINDGSQRQLSAAYRYDCDLSPGTYNGVAYQGVMRNLRGSHVALVPVGRAGADVVISDAALQKGNTMPQNGVQKFAARDDADTEIDPGIRSQLMSYLMELLPSDQLDAVSAILDGQTVASPVLASDSAVRRLARRVVEQHRAREVIGMLERFPDAGRLRR